jgi:hypothetical protein
MIYKTQFFYGSFYNLPNFTINQIHGNLVKYYIQLMTILA